MNALQIENINSKISYQEGKIFNEQGKGYTSLLIKRLYSIGYKAGVSGIIHTLYDNEDKKICTGISWTDLLYNTSIIFN